MRSIAANIGAKSSIDPAVQSASINGTGVDTLGFGSLAFLVQTGAIVGSGVFGASLEDSDDNVTFAAVAADQVKSNAPTALLASSTYKVGYHGFKRYVRPVLTKASGTSIAAGVTAVLGYAASRPVA
ncbi:hypothetical protein HFO42_20225 [Rhizobium leguminosarum]|uniref:Uncharacterized protein n=1 Tax=Rhizobium leguminosarum TaxID=384 RepID=A0AAJ1AAN3_RHILE|nr:hypothetical protein [Rhizobium leguminosarum]MBY5630418.1 hypothetical protein [Rhizobium leguminosarum]